MQNRTNLIILIAAIACVQFHCAKQAFPPGGPIDKLPPMIVSTTPMSGATNVPLDTNIEIRFSERVQRQSVEYALFITPNPGRNLKYRWRGKRLRLKLPETLRPNRTYVITIGTGTKDMRNNALAQSFSLAFSTGSELDQCVVTGKVYGDGQVEGTQIWAYDLSENPMPNPSLLEPLYITQSGAQGDFTFSNLATGRYRLVSIIDRDANQIYDPEYDALGVASKDVELVDENSRVEWLNFKLAIRDTTPPSLTSVSTADCYHIDLRFSESLSTESTSDTSNIAMISGTDSLRIFEVYLDERSPLYLHVVTSAQNEGTEYIVKINQLWDLSGHGLDSTRETVVFNGIGLPDTIGPRVINISPLDSSTGIALDSKIEVFFSEPMERKSVERVFSLIDSLDRRIAGSFTWSNGAHLIFRPDTVFSSLMTYTVAMPVDSVFDLFDNPLGDTLFQKIFTTLNRDTLSAISGVLTDADTTAQGTFFLSAQSLDRGGAKYETQIQQPGMYEFLNILPGTYLIDVYRDEDGNDRYSYGEIMPYVPAERFYVFPDSIKVRSRWPNVGNDIVLPK